jgi:protoporphyrinogen oxidase
VWRRHLKHPVVIIGAGPAGLTTAYELSKHNISSVVLEKSSTVGGLARTAEYKGYLFDVGGHRFFTKVSMVERMWREMLGEDFLRRPRLSRIYYNSRFFHYPLKPWNALRGLGLLESIRCGISYLNARLFPASPEDSLEAWVSNRFGRRLFEIFFRVYTEKVWGIPCSEIRAEWATQRIRDLSLTAVAWRALRPRRNADKRRAIKTLIHEFEYPRRGPGMMWEKFREIIERGSSRVVLGAPVDKILGESGRVLATRAGGTTYEGDHFISSMPIRELIECLEPSPPEHLWKARNEFSYRDFLTVALIVRGRNLFPDNWIYVHDPAVKVGRIQNYKNWSPDMAPDPETTCLGLEYFCFEGDSLWRLPDRELIELGKKEVAELGLADAAAIIDGTVLRVQKAYPVYDRSYERALAAARELESAMPNLQLVGRNGMHRYNNQDHSMLTGILAARNIMGGDHDLWSVNADADYQEQGEEIAGEELADLVRARPDRRG